MTQQRSPAELAAVRKKFDAQTDLAFTQKHVDEIFAEQIEKVPEAERETYREAFRTESGKRADAQKKLLNKYPAANVTAGVIYQYRPKYREELAKFDKRMAEIRKDRPVERFLRVLSEVPGEVSKSVLFLRGDYRAPGHEMSPGVLSVLTDPEKPHEIATHLESLKTTGRRLQRRNGASIRRPRRRSSGMGAIGSARWPTCTFPAGCRCWISCICWCTFTRPPPRRTAGTPRTPGRTTSNGCDGRGPGRCRQSSRDWRAKPNVSANRPRRPGLMIRVVSCR